jgi:hypothetical protein
MGKSKKIIIVGVVTAVCLLLVGFCSIKNKSTYEVSSPADSVVISRPAIESFNATKNVFWRNVKEEEQVDTHGSTTFIQDFEYKEALFPSIRKDRNSNPFHKGDNLAFMPDTGYGNCFKVLIAKKNKKICDEITYYYINSEEDKRFERSMGLDAIIETKRGYLVDMTIEENIVYYFSKESDLVYRLSSDINPSVYEDASKIILMSNLGGDPGMGDTRSSIKVVHISKNNEPSIEEFYLDQGFFRDVLYLGDNMFMISYTGYMEKSVDSPINRSIVRFSGTGDPVASSDIKEYNYGMLRDY